MTSRPFSDFPRNEQGLVDNFIGTAYDTVKRVGDNLPEIGRLDDVLAEIPELAESVAKAALEEELPKFQDEIDTRLTGAVDSLGVLIAEETETFDLKVSTATSLMDQKLQTGQLILDGSQAAYDATTVARDNAAFQAANAANSADLSAVSAGTASAAADQAQTSAKVYPDTAAGILATADGSYFSIPSPDTYEYLILYRRVGSTANEIKRYPSAQIDTLVINKGKGFPYKRMTRSGINSPPQITMNNLVLGIKVIGEDSYLLDKYFRVAYIQNGALIGGVAGYGIIIEQFDSATYATAAVATTINALSDPAPMLVPGSGITTVVISPISAPLIKILLTVDTAALPATGTPVSSNFAASDGYSWIIDPTCYVPMAGVGNSISINRGRAFPLKKMVRNNITSSESLAFSKAILKIQIKGARPGKYYRLAYFVNGSTALPAAKPDGWIIEEINKENYSSAANPALQIITVSDAATPTITRDGIQTISIPSAVVLGIKVYITLDTTALPAYGNQIGSTGTTQSGYSYIIDPSCYDEMRETDTVNSITINAGQVAPFRLTSRGGAVSAPNPLQTNVILDIRVFNAKPGKYYGLRYFQNGNSAVVPAADGWIIEEVDIDGYADSLITTPNSISSLADSQPVIDRALGIQTVLLNTKSDVRIQVTLDASKLLSYGTAYGMNAPFQAGYSLVIDPACYETSTGVTASGSRLLYKVDITGRVTVSWSDGVDTRGFVFGDAGANNLPNFYQLLKNGGVLASYGTDWLPPITFEASNNGDGRVPLEFSGGNHLIDGAMTAVNDLFVIEADGVPVVSGDSGSADQITCRVINKVMANNTVSLNRYPLLQSFQVDFKPGVVNVHAEVMALEDLEMYVDYGCQVVTTEVNDTLFYVGGQYAAPILWDGTVNSGSPSAFPNAWAVLTSSVNGQLAAWIDRDYGIADGSQVYEGYGLIIGGGGASTKQYTTAIHKFLQRNPANPNFMPLLAGKSYKWRGGYSWGKAGPATGFVGSFHYLDNGLIRRCDAMTGEIFLKP